MPIAIKMPALSPTMEEGTLSRWLVKVGDSVASGDIMAEIETDKATMEFEAVDEGVIAEIAVAEGTEGVKVGTVIAMLAVEGEDASAPAPVAAAPAPAASSDDGIKISPSARKLAEEKGVDLASVKGTGPEGRIVKADIENAPGGVVKAAAPEAPAPAPFAQLRASGSGDRVIASPLAKRIAEQRGISLAQVTRHWPEWPDRQGGRRERPTHHLRSS